MDFRLIVLSALILSFLVSVLLTPVAMKLAPKIGAMDTPEDDRRMHTKPVPLFGGVAIFIGTMATFFLIKFFLMDQVLGYLELNNIQHNYREIQEGLEMLDAVMIGGTLIFIVGVIDDLFGMSARLKFLLQIFCATVVYALGLKITIAGWETFLPGGIWHEVAFYLVTVLWIVGITNTINLIDGLDGLAAGVAAIASISIAYTAYIHGMYTVTLTMLAVGGSALGFLPYNFNPAKTFMGDGGSLFLGFMLATISIIGPTKSATIVATIIPVLVLGVPIFDAAFAILRRFMNKKPIMEADKAHLHHRLIDSGLGVKRSVLMLYGISGIMGIAAVVFSRDLFFESIGLFVIAMIFIFVLLWDWNKQES